MRAGEFPDGSRMLRAKIDMAWPKPEHARLVLNDDLDGTLPVRARTTSHAMDNYLHRSAVNLSDFVEIPLRTRISASYDQTRYG